MSAVDAAVAALIVAVRNDEAERLAEMMEQTQDPWISRIAASALIRAHIRSRGEVPA